MGKRFEIRLSEEEYKILEKKTRETGFYQKSEYIKFLIFSKPTFIDKIDTIHKMIENDIRIRQKKK